MTDNARRIVPVVFGLAALASCGNNSQLRQGRAGEASRSPFDFAADTGLQLVAFVLRDTVQLGGAVDVAVLLKNGGAPRQFRNDPDYFHFDVVAPNGRRVEREAPSFEPPALGSTADVMLTRRSILGQVVNLGCAESPFATQSRAACTWSYSLREPGEYKIVARYEAPPSPAGDVAGPHPRLRSDTVRVIVSAR